MDDPSSLRRFHQVILRAGILTLAVYGLAVGIVLSLFREEVRSQILQRDGTLLTSVAQHFYDRLESPDDSIDLLDVALESSDLGGVIAVRLYAPDGTLLGKVPASLYEIGLPAGDLHQLANGKPLMRHFRNRSLETLFSDQIDLEAEEAPALTEILAPIRDSVGAPVAIIQYWLDGAEVSGELAQLDQFLVGLGLVFILAGGL
ncbi:MAG TPA: hypothetical protein VK995_06245, partial [Oceanipulchritudo sp.]|nr:hypothetical protein [Oceanipulchritudo sp.]